MNKGEQAIFRDQLFEANRALIALGTVNVREMNALTSFTVRDCLCAYIALLKCRAEMPLSPNESSGLQGVLNRLRAYLIYFGEDV